MDGGGDFFSVESEKWRVEFDIMWTVNFFSDINKQCM